MVYLITCPLISRMHRFARFANTCATSLIATNKAINAVIPTLDFCYRFNECTSESHEIKASGNKFLITFVIYQITATLSIHLITTCGCRD